MNEQSTVATTIKFPDSLVKRADISRLVREIEEIDSKLTAGAVREKVGVALAEDIVMTELMRNFATLNHLNLANKMTRNNLLTELERLKNTIPVIHLTFAVPIDPDSLEELIRWFRSEINPLIVLEVGLQPSLVAGVSIRTDNHIHDWSLRSLMRQNTDAIVKQLEALRAGNQ